MLGISFPAALSRLYFIRVLCLLAFLLGVADAIGEGIASPGTALVRHAPEISGTVQGSIQQMLGENMALSGGGTISKDLLVPGTPTLIISGKPSFDGTVTGSGSAAPSSYTVTLNGKSRLAHLVTRTDVVALRRVSLPANPAGSRDLTVNSAGENIGSWNTVRNLTLNGNAGQYVVPAGVYGDFIASAGSGFTLGTAGSTQRSVYEFQRLTLSGHARLEIVGPVIIKVRFDMVHSGQAGTTSNPEWLEVEVMSGGITLSGGSSLHGYTYAPNGTAIIDGNAELNGGLECDRLRVQGRGVLRLWQRDTSGGNLPPVGQDQAVHVPEDVPTPITLTAVDPDNGTISYTVTSQPTHGALSGSASNLVYTPTLHSNQPDSFTFVVSDGQATSAPATVSITIIPENDRPKATPQSVPVTEDIPLPLTLEGSDVEGAALTIVEVTDPPHGTVSLVDGTWVYTPDTNYNGNDLFSFKVFDGEFTSDPADVAVTVTPQNDEPTAIPRSVTVKEDDQVSITFAGLDVDGDPLTFSVVTQPSHGALTDIPDGKIYRPNPNFDESDAFTYAASDSELTSDPAPVTIAVIPENDRPIAHSKEIQTDEDVAIAISLAGTDVDSASLSYLPDAEPMLGTLTRTGNVWTYTPDLNKTGIDTFTFRVSDGELISAAAEVRVLVGVVNDRPEAHDQTVAAIEDSPQPIVLTANDVDGDGLAYEVLTQPANGVLAGSDRDWVYTPATNFHEADSFTFRVFDGTVWSEVATVAINVAPVNDAPLVNAGENVSITAPQLITVQGTASDDSDPSAPQLAVTWSLVSGPGDIAFSDPNALQATATYSRAGLYILRLTASDGILETVDELEVAVAQPNRPPVVNAGPDLRIDLAATAVLVGTLSDDGLPAGSGLTATWSKFSGPGTVTFTNAASAATNATFSVPGEYVLSLRASDGEITAQDLSTIYVLAPNAAPTVSAGSDRVVEQGTQLTVPGTVTDDGLPRGAGLTTHWDLLSGPGAVVFVDPYAAGAVATFTEPGTYILRLTSSDSELSSTDDVTVSVISRPNKAPSANAGADQTLVGSFAAQLTGTASDDGLPSSATLTTTWSKVSGPGAVNFANSSSVQTAATFSESGIYVLRFSASDSVLTSMDDVTISVNGINHPPVVEAGPDQSLTLNPEPSANLLRNPSAEEAPIGVDYTPGWTNISSAYRTRTESGLAPADGSAYFWPFLWGTAELRQDVDLTAYQASIQENRLIVRLRGEVAVLGYAGEARITVEFYDFHEDFDAWVI